MKAWAKAIIFGIVLLILIAAGFRIFGFSGILSASNDSLQHETVIDNLNVPWAIDFLPDGRMIFTERIGLVKMYDGKDVLLLGELPIKEVSESGLLGVASHPNFDSEPYIYVYYTKTNVKNRLSRFTFADNKLADEQVLIDDIEGARFHDGGRLKFGPDGKLYLTTGDATVRELSQDLSSLNGKTLRINPDGSIPSDNPFPGSYVYSYGHRNSQGIAWHPETGLMYQSEHGQTANDEINIVLPGKNYGWPNTECTESSPSVENPIRCFSEFTLAPGDLAFVGNDLYVVGLRGAQLRKLTLDNDGKTILKEEIVIDSLGRLRDVVYHDGYLYVTTSNRDGRGIPKEDDDKIVRIKVS